MCCETPCRYCTAVSWYGYIDAQIILSLSPHVCMVKRAKAKKEEISGEPEWLRPFLTGTMC